MDPFTALPSAFLALLYVFFLLAGALMLVSLWRIYVKMGVPGWQCLVPFYNAWVIIDRLGKPKSWFWIYLVGSMILGFTSQYVQQRTLVQVADGTYLSGGLIFVNLLMFVVAIVVLVYSIKVTHALSKAFGYNAGYTVGLTLLPVVFLPILAFGESRFLPERPVTAPSATP